MPLEPNSVSPYCLRFTAPCPFAGDLAPVLARGLGLSPAEVRATQGGTGVLLLSSQVRPERATALARALGLAVDAAEDRPRRALAFLPRPNAGHEALALWLADLTGRTPARLLGELRRPGGAQFHDLPVEQVQAWQAACRGRRDLDVAVSPGEGALHDLFGPIAPALAADLRILGIPACPVTGARAAGLDRTLQRWLERRHAVKALDRAFQRFDLVMLGCGRFTPREAADFLSPRTGLGLEAFSAASARAPLRIEAALSRETALRFLADYRQIGVPVALRLTGGGDA